MKILKNSKRCFARNLTRWLRKANSALVPFEIVHKLTDTIKNIDKIEMLDEDAQSERGSSYRRSYGGDWEANGTYDHYSGRRGRGRDGRYVSRAEARDDMMSMLEDARMSAGDEREKEVIDRAMSQLRNM